MKNTVLGFNQEKLIKIKEESKININGNDLFVLRAISDLIDNNDLKINNDGKEYTRVEYSNIVESLPMISDKMDTFKKIITKLRKANLIELFLLKKGGTFTYLRKTDLLNDLENKKENKENNDKKIKDENKEEKGVKKSIQVERVEEYLERELNEEESNKVENLNLEKLDKAIETSRSYSGFSVNYILKVYESLKDGSEGISNKKVNNSNFKKQLRFSNYEQRNVDYDEIEDELLGWDEEEESIETIAERVQKSLQSYRKETLQA